MSEFHSYVVHGPAGSGKTTAAARICAALGMRRVYDEWDRVFDAPPGTLYLSQTEPRFCPPGVQVLGIHEARAIADAYDGPAFVPEPWPVPVPPGVTVKQARDVRVGDRLVVGRHEYRIEDVTETNVGMLAFSSGNGTATDCRWPDETVWVR